MSDESSDGNGQTGNARTRNSRCPKILVVDDIQDNLDLIVEIFGSDPWNVKTADNAKDAWAIIKRWHPDLVLLDIRMPDYDGHHLCTAIGLKGELDDMSVIFLTSEYTDKTEIERGMKMGASDYICRPVDGRVLRQRVRAVIQRHRQPSATTGISP